MGLISHQLEEAGIATVGISTAKDITEAVRMPRAAFLDYPQGFTVGKPNNMKLSKEILKSTLEILNTSVDETLVDLAIPSHQEAVRSPLLPMQLPWIEELPLA